eukprot:m.206848 g.206848  ORF g.206848 m.206848 type:complete len:57 (+) comp13758_c1_seq2:457-627(+)
MKGLSKLAPRQPTQTYTATMENNTRGLTSRKQEESRRKEKKRFLPNIYTNRNNNKE